MRRKKLVSRDEILAQMMEMALQPCNDALRLAFLSEDAPTEIAQLKLCAISEFKRNANGTVEVKLADRLSILQALLDRLEAASDAPGLAFLQALGEAPRETDAQVSRR